MRRIMGSKAPRLACLAGALVVIAMSLGGATASCADGEASAVQAGSASDAAPAAPAETAPPAAPSGAAEDDMELGKLEGVTPQSGLSAFASETIPTHYELLGIVSDPEVAQLMAIIDYQGESFIVTEGTYVPSSDDPAIIVRNVLPDRVVAFDPRTERIVRRSLRPP